ncbi:MAG: hydroxymethylbilane synthase [Alphaproteobacteria bacterium]
MKQILKIGTRGSPLALAQAKTVQAKLAQAHPELKTALVVIRTSGDWNPADGDVRLSAAQGGKGQFAKEIEQALLSGEIHAAVHSMKDMDSHLPEGLIINHMLEREDPRDALLLRERPDRTKSIKNKELAKNSQLKIQGVSAIPQNAIVGTASVRRGAALLSKRPDLTIVPFRGNVHTRINKLRKTDPDNTKQNIACTLLAVAGMNRLGITGEADFILEPEDMLPAAGQGAVGIEIPTAHKDTISVFSHISHLNTVLCVKSERAALRTLDGSCHTPIGAYAIRKECEIWLRVCVISLDGKHRFEDEIHGTANTIDDAEKLGEEIGLRLKKRIPPEILTQSIADDPIVVSDSFPTRNKERKRRNPQPAPAKAGGSDE